MTLPIQTTSSAARAADVNPPLLIKPVFLEITPLAVNARKARSARNCGTTTVMVSSQFLWKK